MRASIEPVLGLDIGGLAGVGMGIADYGAWIAVGVAMLALAGLARWSMTPTRRVDPPDAQREEEGVAPTPLDGRVDPSHARVGKPRRDARPHARADQGSQARSRARGPGRRNPGRPGPSRRPGRPGRPGHR